MADYQSTAKKFTASEERLLTLLDDLNEARRLARACNYSNPEHAPRAEKLFDAAKKERKVAQALFDDLKQMYERHWRHEYERQLDLAREALIPLARAWRISHRAFGATGHFPSWAQGRFSDELLLDAAQATANAAHDLPLDPPASFALERADDELRC